MVGAHICLYLPDVSWALAARSTLTAHSALTDPMVHWGQCSVSISLIDKCVHSPEDPVDGVLSNKHRQLARQ